MTRKLIFTILVACLVFTGAYAQNLQNNIPKDATFVFTLNPSVLNSKVKFSKLKEFDFFKKGMEEMTKQAGPMAGELKKFINDPGEFGMDMMSSSYAFGKIDGDDVHMAYVLKIGDKSKFDNLIQTYVAPMMPVQKDNNMEYVSADGVNLSWNGNQILISTVELGYNEEEEYSARKERKEKEAKSWMNTIMNGGNMKNSINMNPTFKLANVGSDDANFFVDYETFAKMSNDLQGGGDPMTRQLMDMMSGMYKDSYISMGLNFNKGATQLKSKYFMNDETMDIYRQISNSTFNKKFLKYLPKDNLGYMTFNMNFAKLVEVVKSSDHPMLQQFPLYEGMALEGLKSMGIDMTADDAYKLWSGDAMIVVTGVKDFEKEVTTYEFDDDFNKIEKKEMKKEKLPEFVMLMSHKNKAGLLKLIDLGKQSSMISEAKGFFQVNVPDMPMDVFMKVQDDMILVSNNKDVVTKKAKKVYKRKNLMKVKDAARIMSSISTFHWDIPKTMAVMEEMGANDMGREQEMLFNMGKENFRSLDIRSDKKIGKSIDTIMNLNMNNKEMNALEQIFGMINEMVVSMGGTSM